MQKTAMDLQEQFLYQARRERMGLTVFLMNGFQMRGVVTGYDQFTVVLECEGKQELVYKHAISTIIPARPAELILEG
jgi:host factor-I protein